MEYFSGTDFVVVIFDEILGENSHIIRVSHTLFSHLDGLITGQVRFY